MSCFPLGQTKPISVDMLTIAPSGERKTTVDNLAVLLSSRGNRSCAISTGGS